MTERVRIGVKMGPSDWPADILLVEDDPGDVLLIVEALEAIAQPPTIHVVGDGQEAMEFLRREGTPTPDVILLDLNMPRLDGRGTLTAIKNDPDLKHIPVIVLTTSRAPDDISGSYGRHANAYVTKPTDLDDLTNTVHQIESFFVHIAELPRRPLAG